MISGSIHWEYFVRLRPFYFLDNNGEIDLEEMANIIDTLDCIEGVQAGAVRYDENGHPVDTPTALQRAQDLFLVRQTLLRLCSTVISDHLSFPSPGPGQTEGRGGGPLSGGVPGCQQ